MSQPYAHVARLQEAPQELPSVHLCCEGCQSPEPSLFTGDSGSQVCGDCYFTADIQADTAHIRKWSEISETVAVRLVLAAEGIGKYGRAGQPRGEVFRRAPSFPELGEFEWGVRGVGEVRHDS